MKINRLSRVAQAWLTGILAVCFVAFAPIRTVLAAEEVLNQTNQNGIPYVNGIHSNDWPQIVTQAAVVMDMNTGTIVYAKNPLQEHYPASITKIMTAILALQHGHLNDVLTASKNAVDQPPDKLYMVPGEKEKLQSLLYGLLMISANDAAVEIAQNYGGSVSNFAKMMNTEAKQLGATHTHFDNPNGLPDPNHVTTAYDMALIARAAMQYPEFRKIVQTKYYDWQGQAWKSHLSNINHMLFNYPGCIGLKTGYTSVAHETLVVAATHGKDTFLAVLMDTPTEAEIEKDATNLLNYAFAHYQTQTIVEKGETVGSLPGSNANKLIADESVAATVPVGAPLQLQSRLSYAIPTKTPVNATVGTVHLLDSHGQELGTVKADLAAPWIQTDEVKSVRIAPILIPLVVVLSILLRMFRFWLRKKIRRTTVSTVNRGRWTGYPRDM